MLQQMRRGIAKAGMGVVVALLACATTLAQDVTTNFMPGTDFTKYHTYKWVTIQGASYPNQIVDAQIKDAVGSQLAAKGLSKTDGDNADLYVGYQVSIRSATTVERVRHGWGPRLGWRHGHRSKLDHQYRNSCSGYV